MTKGRLEAFSDGVIAIIITIMVIEFHPPHGAGLADLRPLVPKLLSYALSFVFLGIYWNNHHHMLQAVKRVSGGVLWANLHLLFWLSLVPFGTAWMGETHFASGPAAAYGVILLGAAIAYYVLSRRLIEIHESGSTLEVAVGSDLKGRLSLVCYLAAIPLAFVNPAIACAIYVLVAVLWLVPDRRIERQMAR